MKRCAQFVGETNVSSFTELLEALDNEWLKCVNVGPVQPPEETTERGLHHKCLKTVSRRWIQALLK